MSMSDCVKCWDTPCSCGYYERTMGPEFIDRKIKQLKELRRTYFPQGKPTLEDLKSLVAQLGTMEVDDSPTSPYANLSRELDNLLNQLDFKKEGSGNPEQ